MHGTSRAGRGVFLGLLLLAVALHSGTVRAQADEFSPPGGPEIRLVAPFESIPASSRTTVLIGLANEGPDEAFDVEVDFRPQVGSEVSVIGFDGGRRFDLLEENETRLIGLILATPAEAGAIRIIAHVSYADEAGVRRSIEREVALQIRPPDTDPLDIEYLADPLVAGHEADLKFRLRNLGGRPITHLELRFLADEDVRTSPGSGTGTSSLGLFGGTLTPVLATPLGSRVLFGLALAPGDEASVTVPVRVSLSSPDVTAFTMVARYTFEGYQRAQDVRFSDIVAKSVTLRLLELREERVGDTLELTGLLVNVGSGTAFNPRLSTESGAYRSDRPRVIEDMEPNDAVQFRILVERQDGFAVRLNVSWNDEYGEEAFSLVNGTPTQLPEESVGAFSSFLDRLPPLWVLALIGLLIAVLAYLVRRRHRSLDN